MAYKIIWSVISRDDLRGIVRFIAADNPVRALTFGIEIISSVDKLQDFPELGRMVPERRDPLIREVLVRPYRVIYRVGHSQQVIEIARVWHAARGNPELALPGAELFR